MGLEHKCFATLPAQQNIQPPQTISTKHFFRSQFGLQKFPFSQFLFSLLVYTHTPCLVPAVLHTDLYILAQWHPQISSPDPVSQTFSPSLLVHAGHHLKPTILKTKEVFHLYSNQSMQKQTVHMT